MEISPEKCGIKISPPSFVIFYPKGDTLRMKKMPLRNFKSSSNVQFVARNLKERHSLERIPLVKIEKLLSYARALRKAHQKLLRGTPLVLLPYFKLRQFLILSSSWSNQIPIFQSIFCFWGYDDDPYLRQPPISTYQLPGVSVWRQVVISRLLQELLNGVDKLEAIKKIDKEFEIKVNEDLNKLSVHELDRQKELMDSLFLKNQIKKDDENFIYDKQMDFTGEKEESNWDLDDNFWD